MTTFNSNLINQGLPGSQGVYPLSRFGSVLIPSGTTLTAADVIRLCQIAPTTVLEDFIVQVPDLDSGSPALTLSLQDNLASPTVYVSASTKGQAGGIISMAVDLNTGVLGTAYTSPPLTLVNPLYLQLVVGVTAGGATGSDLTILFRVTWSPLGSTGASGAS